MSASVFRQWRRIALAVCAAVMMASPASVPSARTPAAAPSPVEPNFDLGARWTSAKVSQLVFDTSVTPHWFQSGDRFWYAFQTRDGRPPRNRTLRFDYDLASGRLTLDEDFVAPAQRPRWASISPDEQTVIFARNHNLYVMDAANYAKAQKSANDATIVETRLTTDGEENFSYARTIRGGDDQQQQQAQQQDQNQMVDQAQQDAGATADKNARVAAVNIVWSQDSKRFARLRRDERKVKDLWVINAQSNPRPTLEYRVGYDGSGLKLLNAGTASHAVSISDNARYFIDNASRVDTVPESAVYDTLGNVVAKLETPDVSALKEAGFKFPEPFTVKADDGVTDLYGVMDKPFDFDETRKYPIIGYAASSNATGSVSST